MPKKTFYTKQELEEQKNQVQEPKPVEKTQEQIVNDEIDKAQTEIIKKELQIDSIKKKVNVKVKKGRPVRLVVLDENGNKLKKDGTIDKRAETGLKNLKNSRVYQQILENKKLKESTKPVLTPYVESSDSEPEFSTDIKLEIEPDEPTTKRSTGTDDFIKKQEAEREQMLAAADELRFENKKLKESFHYNSHLNRMQSMATQVKLKF